MEAVMKSIRNLFAVVFLALATVCLAGPVDINTATADQLAAAMTGVGPSKAAEIVAYREKHGPFGSVQELAQVKGIGDKTIESNLDNITVGAQKSASGQ
jgi:competence protein ComEA